MQPVIAQANTAKGHERMVARTIKASIHMPGREHGLCQSDFQATSLPMQRKTCIDETIKVVDDLARVLYLAQSVSDKAVHATC